MRRDEQASIPGEDKGNERECVREVKDKCVETNRFRFPGREDEGTEQECVSGVNGKHAEMKVHESV